MLLADQNTKKADQVTEKHFTVTLTDEGILHLEIEPNHTLTLEDAKRTVEAFGFLGGGKKYPILISGGSGASSADHEAREFSATDEGCKYSLADAILISSMSQKLIANFYLRFYNLKIPTRIFTDRNAAVKWLKRFVE